MILNMIQIVTKNVQVCESARINFETVTREAKRNCKCHTKLCPNWECTCIGDEILVTLATALVQYVTAILALPVR